ncbi:glutamate--tRNA ligase [Pedobacter metabolipauper]|uniref:Glutamate--tRNA ligase n=1 Tax=Pedobacter metabolipauper TaxID=425513 RepID=A0A4R6SW36_9SPHI|nr:glutamate--tRNA ligase [Pedobacter metabolipauper]TDQ09621.1 glutamyl-tRNA synthetase [Pedobacter metabolipauper]
MEKKVRVRFAPSPTGGLHLGGVRTALFNYLFAKKHNGTFILRVEDTDQTRFVEGAEEYITSCLQWCGISPDESPAIGGPFAPYRQSERKATYKQYADQLITDGYAYYAFDTPEELDAKRKEIPNFTYGLSTRDGMRNSLTLSETAVSELLAANTPYVVRIKMPKDELVSFNDLIRGFVSFDTNLVDDKVLLKADGMPTYHLAVVADDKAMEISHIFRGEEWLPSAPIHILLWRYLGWEDQMPQWVHLPLILKPDGNGKLSKRDGDRLGFPVYAQNWTDPKTGDLTKGFKELGFMPEAFVNLLAMLGWNDGTDQEIFSLEELVEKFSIERVSKAGAKFDFEKAKWYNHEWIKTAAAEKLLPAVKAVFADQGVAINDDVHLSKIIDLIKDRCNLITDFFTQGIYFFVAPSEYDSAAVKPKWSEEKALFFKAYTQLISDGFSAAELEEKFKELAVTHNFKPGELMLPLRIMLVGGKFGPGVFDIAVALGAEETKERIANAIAAFN